jgi:hypothetical protein
MPLGAAVARQAKAAWARHRRSASTNQNGIIGFTGRGLGAATSALGLDCAVDSALLMSTVRIESCDSRGELPGLRKRKSFWRARRHAASLPIQLACRHTTSACV